MKNKKKIFFVGYGGGHIAMLIPVLQALRAENNYELIVLGLTTASERLREAGILHIGYRHLIEKGDMRALEIGEKMAQKLGASSKISWEETVAYLGLSFHDLIDRLGEDQARKEFGEKGRQAFLQLTILERAFCKYKPDLVVATNSPRSEKAAILTARKMGIPSICLMDLFDPREFEDRIGQPGYADRVCVFSEAVKNDLLTYGRAERDIVATGNPAFDSLSAPDLQCKATKLRDQKGWGSEKVILWVRQVNPNDWELYKSIESVLFDLVGSHEDWRVVIRPHPSDTTLFDNLPERVSLSNQADDLSALLQAVNVVATVNSTVGIQGAIIGKPLINIDLGAVSAYTPYSKMGLSIGVKDLDNLEDAILKALQGFRPEGELPKPGGSTQAVINEIRELI